MEVFEGSMVWGRRGWVNEGGDGVIWGWMGGGFLGRRDGIGKRM